MEEIRWVAFIDPGNFETFQLCGVINGNGDIQYGDILYLLNSKKLLLQIDKLLSEMKYLLGSLVSDEIMNSLLIEKGGYNYFETGCLHIQLNSCAAPANKQSYQTLWQRCSKGIIMRWDGHFFTYKAICFPVPMSFWISKQYHSIDFQRMNDGGIWTVNSHKKNQRSMHCLRPRT